MDSKPKQTELPWWVTLISVVVTAVVCVMGTVYALGGGAPKVPGGPPGVASLVSDTITYIPHIMLLFGVLADMFTYEGVYSIPSLVGILSIFFNWIFKYFWKGIEAILEKSKLIAKSEAPKAGPVVSAKRFTPAEELTAPELAAKQRKAGFGMPVSRQTGGALSVSGGIGTFGKTFFQDYDGCNVQGFSSFASEYAPQTLVVTATVFMYYLFDNVLNRGWINSLAGLLFFAAVYIGQAFVIKSCQPPEGGRQWTMTQQSLMALIEGAIMGGLSYATVAAYYPTRLPSSVVSPFPRKSRNDLTLGPDGGYVDDQGNPYIVLPNGQAMPDLSTLESRKRFADMAGQNLASDKPAMPGNCSATA